MCSQLLAAGANKGLRNKTRATAEEVASARGFQDIARLLGGLGRSGGARAGEIALKTWLFRLIQNRNLTGRGRPAKLAPRPEPDLWKGSSAG